jgi:hypothetical protein
VASTPVLYALRPSGPEISRRALLRRLRDRGIPVVTLPAGHYILGEHRATIDGVVAELNANLRRLAVDDLPAVEDRLEVLFQPIPAPDGGEAS